jgi:hypothetical protein
MSNETKTIRPDEVVFPTPRPLQPQGRLKRVAPDEIPPSESMLSEHCLSAVRVGSEGKFSSSMVQVFSDLIVQNQLDCLLGRAKS